MASNQSTPKPSTSKSGTLAGKSGKSKTAKRARAPVVKREKDTIASVSLETRSQKKNSITKFDPFVGNVEKWICDFENEVENLNERIDDRGYQLVVQHLGAEGRQFQIAFQTSKKEKSWQNFKRYFVLYFNKFYIKNLKKLHDKIPSNENADLFIEVEERINLYQKFYPLLSSNDLHSIVSGLLPEHTENLKNLFDCSREEFLDYFKYQKIELSDIEDLFSEENDEDENEN